MLQQTKEFERAEEVSCLRLLLLAQVVVAEGAPRHGGQELAKRLAQAGMHTTLIPDSAIFAMMARVNKVALLYVLLADISPAAHSTDTLKLLFKSHSSQRLRPQGSGCCPARPVAAYHCMGWHCGS